MQHFGVTFPEFLCSEGRDEAQDLERYDDNE